MDGVVCFGSFAIVWMDVLAKLERFVPFAASQKIVSNLTAVVWAKWEWQ